MDTKTKITKILPYWITGTLLLCTAVLLPVLFKPQTVNSESLSGAPQVLGASTVSSSLIRGQTAAGPLPLLQINAPDTSKVKAQSFLVFDLASGQILLQKNPGQKLAIASLTKLMTALVAYNNLNLNLNFSITAKDVLNVSPALHLTPGDSVSALNVFNAMLIGSCNDAALALSNYTADQTGKNFVGLMNQQAVALGMVNTNYANPLGFDNLSNYSTADDLKLLITNIQKLSTFTDLGRRTGYSFTGSLGKTYSTVATNTLIKNHPDIEAIKTGFTAEANGAMATKVDFGGRQIVILVLDSGDREGDTLKLKDTLQQNFKGQ